MPDFDLSAVRADIATVAATDGPVYGIDGLEEVRSAQAAQGRVLDVHAPAMADELDRRDAVIVRLRAELDAANARTAERCRQLMAAQRTVEQANAERDHWQRVAAGGGDCPVVGCNGEVLRLVAVGGEEFVRLDCGHDPASTVGTEAHPSEDAYLVEQQDPLLVDEPYQGWMPATSVRPDESVMRELMRVKRERVPDRPPMRVVRRCLSWTVVAVEESAGDVKPPESPAEPPAPLAPDPAA